MVGIPTQDSLQYLMYQCTPDTPGLPALTRQSPPGPTKHYYRWDSLSGASKESHRSRKWSTRICLTLLSRLRGELTWSGSSTETCLTPRGPQRNTEDPVDPEKENPEFSSLKSRWGPRPQETTSEESRGALHDSHGDWLTWGLTSGSWGPRCNSRRTHRNSKKKPGDSLSSTWAEALFQ